jgi:apolipoprotein N-acyltransferase
MPPIIERLATFLGQLQGKKAYCAAFLLGVAYTAAFPPFWVLPLAIFAFSGLLWMLQESAHSNKQLFAIGWWFGFGHHTTGLYWICIALGIDGGAFWWMMPFALCLLPAYLSLYIGAIGVLLRKWQLVPARQLALFAVLWVVMEWLRAHLIYGFPWNIAGYAWTISDATLQASSVLGVYGMSLWLVLFCSAFSLLASWSYKSSRQVFTVILLLSIAVVGWGQWRVHTAESRIDAAAPLVNVRLVQASVEQSLKWDPKHQLEALESHVNMSMAPAETGFMPDYIIWPETAMPYTLREGSRWLPVLAGMASEGGGVVTGAIRHNGDEANWQVWNSLQVVSPQGNVSESYDKHILVPFGEFIPFRSILPIEKITHGATDFSAGAGAALMSLSPELSVQPLICYEAIFPEYRTDARNARPHWLLNVTNDAWFGVSTGPYQHLHMARTRAVEQGIPLVRVANTGVSAVFDAYGRMQGSIPLGEKDILDSTLPKRIIAPTWYSVYGEATLVMLCYLLFIYAFGREVKTA